MSERSNILLETGESARHRFMLVLSYDGAPFKGWQIQPHDPSVQESIENALRMALRTPLHIVGAGRTDTGVHARYMTAHFDVDDATFEKLADQAMLQRFKKTLNAILRPHVAIHHVVPVPTEAHARFDATLRTYHYYLHTEPDPFRHERSRYFHLPVDFDVMNRSAEDLLGTQDFTSFSKLHTDTNNNICTITDAAWHCYAPGHYYFRVSANRFLRNMVRAIVGTLLDVGTGKASPDHVRRVIEARDRCAAGTSVPGYALYLWDIKYPYELPAVPQPEIL